MSVFLTAIIKSKTGQSAAMKRLLLDLVDGSKSEAACLQYDLHQSTENPEVFIFHEEWASQEGLDLHNSQPHIQKFVDDSASIIDGTTVMYKTERVG
ncbi:antibiotic biosynthesis monooxygenase [Pedobacter sp. HMWF019]|uniref:putative quinol monooxygenase n=1 Tax=Pedobacter sp. HMWF019 TaxID=2056856 RepID=UPI000D38EFCD|nr:putative quinol monooxygenase [Pedobacter sp. HMWF019]PTT01320.1 antibiotic biosynthesis monooxygenase [Pedobacter sp. HMWF019]